MTPAVVRAAVLSVLLMAVFAPPGWAQNAPRGHVFAGLGALRELGTEDLPAVDYPEGWVVAVGAALPWWRLVAVGDVSQHSRTNLVDETQRLFAALGGVRIDLLRTSRVALFGQALAGVERFSEPGFDESGPAFQPGAGVDLWLWRRLGIRGQADVRLSRQSDATYKEVRVSAGIVVGW